MKKKHKNYDLLKKSVFLLPVKPVHFFFLVLKVGSGAKHGVLNDCNLQVVRLWP